MNSNDIGYVCIPVAELQRIKRSVNNINIESQALYYKLRFTRRRNGSALTRFIINKSQSIIKELSEYVK